MKSKLIWVAVFIGIGVFLINNYQEQASERAAKEAERERIEQEVRSVVSQIVARHNAISDWEKILSKGERSRMSPILAIELEKLWQSANPILFVGAIRDVSSSGSET